MFGLARTADQVSYVGRADKDLRAALKSYIGKYPIFWFETALSPDECFAIHCRTYHRQLEDGALDDRLHPAADKPSQKCPVCGV